LELEAYLGFGAWNLVFLFIRYGNEKNKDN
jgi:hypothetical protein